MKHLCTRLAATIFLAIPKAGSPSPPTTAKKMTLMNIVSLDTTPHPSLLHVYLNLILSTFLSSSVNVIATTLVTSSPLFVVELSLWWLYIFSLYFMMLPHVTCRINANSQHYCVVSQCRGGSNLMKTKVVQYPFSFNWLGSLYPFEFLSCKENECSFPPNCLEYKHHGCMFTTCPIKHHVYLCTKTSCFNLNTFESIYKLCKSM